ncbi:MAG: hypothetical protein E7300_09295 [Lachnospiraceae bacterium]|nr:hypothetical protein [Lachnospiraceae bacterium]
MIEMHYYTPREIDTIYTAIEEAVAAKKKIDMLTISEFIKPGDFYLVGHAANGPIFSFMGLKWIQDGDIFLVRIQPHVIAGDPIVQWYPVIVVNERTHSSCGCLDMIRKENRYIDTSKGWAMRELR